MCGIAGFLNFKNHDELAQLANGLQKHRGPDAQGSWSSPNISFSHQRLSIIDPSERSNQPFRKQGLVIVFNGEIYNYKALRQDLEARNVSFQTDSDTEVVLESFRRHGSACLNSFRGMFAFAIWSEATKSLFLARDQLGIKPLYYYQRGRQFAFASELKTLSRILPIERRLSAPGLAALLMYLWLPTAFCILDELQSVPPGHYVIVRHNAPAEILRYWSLSESAPVARSESELVDELCEAFEQSVAHHLVADVEVGAFLSGGVDSSFMCAAARKHVGRLRTFTIGSDGSAKRVERMSSDETFARRVSKMLNTEHSEIIVKPDMIADLPKLISIFDEPIGDPAALNTHLICASARQAGIKVLLSGMGADECFFGYRRQKAWLYAQRYQMLPRGMRTLLERAVAGLPVRIGERGLRSVRWAKKFSSFAGLEPAARYQSSFSYYSGHSLAGLLEPPWRAGVPAVQEHFLGIFAERYPGDPINRLCFTDLNLFLPGLNLAYTDKASMAASVEVRVPFVDVKWIELAMRIPGRFKFKSGQSKYILKKAAERYLPSSIVYRPKASFSVPLRAWISRDLRPMVDDLLTPERLKRRGWVDPATCERMIESDRKGRADFSYQIFQLLVLELWAQAVLDAPRASV